MGEKQFSPEAVKKALLTLAETFQLLPQDILDETLRGLDATTTELRSMTGQPLAKSSVILVPPAGGWYGGMEEVIQNIRLAEMNAARVNISETAFLVAKAVLTLATLVL